ncbi:MAG: hypothetical protein ACLU6B_11265 [Lachnospirales bacterium]
MSFIKKYSILLLFFLFLCSCHETVSGNPSSLLLYPGLDWRAEIDAEVIRKKLRAAYGAPWKECAWQEGRNEWRSGERMIDRLDEKTAQEIWISCDEKGLEEYKKKLGPFSERFLG